MCEVKNELHDIDILVHFLAFTHIVSMHLTQSLIALRLFDTFSSQEEEVLELTRSKGILKRRMDGECLVTYEKF